MRKRLYLRNQPEETDDTIVNQSEESSIEKFPNQSRTVDSFLPKPLTATANEDCPRKPCHWGDPNGQMCQILNNSIAEPNQNGFVKKGLQWMLFELAGKTIPKNEATDDKKIQSVLKAKLSRKSLLRKKLKKGRIRYVKHLNRKQGLTSDSNGSPYKPYMHVKSKGKMRNYIFKAHKPKATKQIMTPVFSSKSQKDKNFSNRSDRKIRTPTSGHTGDLTECSETQNNPQNKLDEQYDLVKESNRHDRLTREATSNVDQPFDQSEIQMNVHQYDNSDECNCDQSKTPISSRKSPHQNCVSTSKQHKRDELNTIKEERKALYKMCNSPNDKYS